MSSGGFHLPKGVFQKLYKGHCYDFFMKKDLYNHKEIFNKWLEEVEQNPHIEGLNNKHSKLVISLIKDFRLGMNVSSKSPKGERSFTKISNTA